MPLRVATLLSSSRAVVRVLLLAGPLLLIGACSSVAAQTPTLPLCPAGQEIIATYPPSYVRRDNSYTATFERTDAGVASVDVEFIAAASPGADATTTTETFTFTGSDEIEFVRATPVEGQSFDLNFSWVQDAGSPAACRGYERHRGIPIVLADAKVGEPGLGRFQGRYRITKRNDPERPTWTLKPVCDLFACSATVRSTGGLRGKFTFEAETGRNGEYVLEQRFKDGYCTVVYSNGRSVKWTAFAYRTIKLRPTKVVEGVATELRGSERWDYDIPSDELGLCESRSGTVARVVAKRR